MFDTTTHSGDNQHIVAGSVLMGSPATTRPAQGDQVEDTNPTTPEQPELPDPDPADADDDNGQADDTQTDDDQPA